MILTKIQFKALLPREKGEQSRRGREKVSIIKIPPKTIWGVLDSDERV